MRSKMVTLLYVEGKGFFLGLSSSGYVLFSDMKMEIAFPEVCGFPSEDNARQLVSDYGLCEEKDAIYIEVKTESEDNYVDLPNLIRAGYGKQSEGLLLSMNTLPTIH